MIKGQLKLKFVIIQTFSLSREIEMEYCIINVYNVIIYDS